VAADRLPGPQAGAAGQADQALLGVPGQVPHLPPQFGALVEKGLQRRQDVRLTLPGPQEQFPRLLGVGRLRFLSA
jgi:hypothetical protein